jgi:hypothetical protein
VSIWYSTLFKKSLIWAYPVECPHNYYTIFSECGQNDDDEIGHQLTHFYSKTFLPTGLLQEIFPHLLMVTADTEGPGIDPNHYYKEVTTMACTYFIHPWDTPQSTV